MGKFTKDICVDKIEDNLKGVILIAWDAQQEVTGGVTNKLNSCFHISYQKCQNLIDQVELKPQINKISKFKF